MSGRFKIDRDTRTLLLKYIRKYDEYKKWYIAERARIIELSPKENDGMPRGSGTSDVVGSAVVQLEKLDNSHRVQVIKAIEKARAAIGDDLYSSSQKQQLKNAIWLSCLNAREYPFEAFAGLVAYERRAFYYCKNQFLLDIKKELGI